MNKKIIFFILIILSANCIFAGMENASVVFSYFNACENKNINAIRMLFVQNKVDEAIKTHDLLFRTVNLHYSNISIEKNIDLKNYDVFVVNVKCDVFSLDRADYFEKKEELLIFIDKNLKKIVKIARKSDYEAFKKLYLYESLLEKIH